MNIDIFENTYKDKVDTKRFPKNMTQYSMTYFDLLCILSDIKRINFVRIKTIFYKNKKIGVGSKGTRGESSYNSKMFNKVYSLGLPFNHKVRIKYHQSPRHCKLTYAYGYLERIRFRYITLYLD